MGDKKKKAADGEDESTANLQKIYRRRCEVNGVSQSKLFREKLEFLLSEDQKFTEVKIWTS